MVEPKSRPRRNLTRVDIAYHKNIGLKTVSKIIRLAVNCTFSYLELFDEPTSISVCITDDKEIKDINLQHRKKNSPTNVLAFPYTDIKQGEKIPKHSACMGDIIISYDTLVKEAQDMDITIEDHIAHMVVHGTLHLLGYDHERSQRDAHIMEQAEIGILQLMKIRNPYE